MNTINIKKLQAEKIAVYYSNTAMNLISKSNDKNLSFKIRKDSIKLAEIYMIKCFAIGNIYELDYVQSGDIEYQQKIMSSYFNNN